jgi:hypothetical protein
LEEGGQVLAFGGLKSLQSQALEIGFGCRNPVRCVRSRSDPVSLEVRRLRIFGQRDKLKADRSKGA